MTYPVAVVFDLDYTLWPCWCDVHIELPIKNYTPETIIDSYGYKLSLYPDVPEIIRDLKRNGVKIISASRTPTVHIAKELISHIQIDNIPLNDYFDNSQWGTGSKIRHIKKAVKDLGLEKDLSQGNIILYDDEFRNKDVEEIGCKFAYIRDTDLGLTWDIYQKGLQLFANN